MAHPRRPFIPLDPSFKKKARAAGLVLRLLKRYLAIQRGWESRTRLPDRLAISR